MVNNKKIMFNLGLFVFIIVIIIVIFITIKYMNTDIDNFYTITPLFSFNANNLSNVSFYNSVSQLTVSLPTKQTDTNGYEYINFNNTFYGINKISIPSATNKNITIECVFKYTGGNGSILNNLGQLNNNDWNNSYLERCIIDFII